MKLARLVCATRKCSTTFRPADKRVKFCDRCRAAKRILRGAPEAEPPPLSSPRGFRPRGCAVCDTTFTPTSSTQKLCPDHRGTAAYLVPRATVCTWCHANRTEPNLGQWCERCRQPMLGWDADALSRFEANKRAGLFAGPPPLVRFDAERVTA